MPLVIIQLASDIRSQFQLISNIVFHVCQTLDVLVQWCDIVAMPSFKKMVGMAQIRKNRNHF